MKLALCLLAFALYVSHAAPLQEQALAGRLVIAEGRPPTIETPGGTLVLLDGDEVTRQVLTDARLTGLQVETKGSCTASGRFLIGPTHTRAMMVRQEGKLKMITYWCPICSIRAFAPGLCVCCFRETDVDLHDPDAL